MGYDTIYYMTEKSFPNLAKILGYAGGIPFIAGGIGIWLFPAPYLSIMANILILYGAVILTFLGAVYWGIGVVNGGPDWLFFYAIAPALLAWGGLALPITISYPIITLGLIIAAGIDGIAMKAGIIQLDYFAFRRNLTILAVVSLIIAWIGII
jgi:hypothetical protein